MFLVSRPHKPLLKTNFLQRKTKSGWDSNQSDGVAYFSDVLQTTQIKVIYLSEPFFFQGGADVQYLNLTRPGTEEMANIEFSTAISLCCASVQLTLSHLELLYKMAEKCQGRDSVVLSIFVFLLLFFWGCVFFFCSWPCEIGCPWKSKQEDLTVFWTNSTLTVLTMKYSIEILMYSCNTSGKC